MAATACPRQYSFLPCPRLYLQQQHPLYTASPQTAALVQGSTTNGSIPSPSYQVKNASKYFNSTITIPVETALQVQRRLNKPLTLSPHHWQFLTTPIRLLRIHISLFVNDGSPSNPPVRLPSNPASLSSKPRLSTAFLPPGSAYRHTATSEMPYCSQSLQIMVYSSHATCTTGTQKGPARCLADANVQEGCNGGDLHGHRLSAQQPHAIKQCEADRFQYGPSHCTLYAKN